MEFQKHADNLEIAAASLTNEVPDSVAENIAASLAKNTTKQYLAELAAVAIVMLARERQAEK